MGVWSTVALVAATGLLGAALARLEGTRALASVQSELAAGRLPARSLLDGAAVLVGGALLLTPGILTDVAGFALLLPVTRRPLYGWLRRRLEAGLASGTVRVTWMGGGFRPPGDPSRTGGEEPRSRLPRDDDEDDRPPRPGEIVQ